MKWDFEEAFEIDKHDYFAVNTVRYWGYEIPAKLTGHPDRMYPGEGEDNLELVGVEVVDQDGGEVQITETRTQEIWKENKAEILKELQEKVA